MNINKIYRKKEILERRIYNMFKKFEKDNDVTVECVDFFINEEEDDYTGIRVKTILKDKEYEHEG